MSGLLATRDRAQMAGGAEPNGWYAGPHREPDRYQLLGPGLTGGEGDIWRARYRGDLTSPLTVAVKRLRRPANMGDDWPTPADLRRWEDLRALLLIMRIDHLVSVLDVFVGPAPHPRGLAATDGAVTPYVVMEWVPGPTLADEFGGVPATAQTLDARLRHVEQVAVALDALHSRTVSAGNPSLHRDVKPTNCILAPDRGVVLVDVGTMRRVDDGRDLSGRHTPAYTAPEVLLDPMAARDPASDLYSLGALAWFCVTGENPPAARDPQAPDRARIRVQVAARNAGVPDPPAFAAHLTWMLSHDPASRPADARAWASRLRGLAAGPRGSARILLAAAVLIPAVAVALVLLPLPLRRDGTRGDLTRAASQTSSSQKTVESANGEGPEKGATSDRAAFRGLADGDTIARCPRLRGTAKLPPGKTLVFSVENLSVGDRIRHLTLIQGWRRPGSLEHWRLRPPVGLPSDPLGERYRLELLVVPLSDLRGQPAGGTAGLTAPADSQVAASVFVSRGSQSAVGCPKPEDLP